MFAQFYIWLNFFYNSNGEWRALGLGCAVALLAFIRHILTSTDYHQHGLPDRTYLRRWFMHHWKIERYYYCLHFTSNTYWIMEQFWKITNLKCNSLVVTHYWRSVGFAFRFYLRPLLWPTRLSPLSIPKLCCKWTIKYTTTIMYYLFR